MKLSNILSIVGIVLLFGVGIFCGYKIYPKVKPCPNITTDTISVPDTNWYILQDSLEDIITNLEDRVNYWKHHRDTVYLPGDSIPVPVDVDTAAILKDYFSVYRYGWEKQDTNIQIVDSVIVTQNAPIWHSLNYKLLRPQQIIINNVDNSISYQSYLQGGLYVPIYNYKADSARFNTINNVMLELTYAWPKGYLGAGWQPLTNTVGIRAGTTIFKFRKRK